MLIKLIVYQNLIIRFISVENTKSSFSPKLSYNLGVKQIFFRLEFSNEWIFFIALKANKYLVDSMIFQLKLTYLRTLENLEKISLSFFDVGVFSTLFSKKGLLEQKIGFFIMIVFWTVFKKKELLKKKSRFFAKTIFIKYPNFSTISIKTKFFETCKTA